MFHTILLPFQILGMNATPVLGVEIIQRSMKSEFYNNIRNLVEKKRFFVHFNLNNSLQNVFTRNTMCKNLNVESLKLVNVEHNEY